MAITAWTPPDNVTLIEKLIALPADLQSGADIEVHVQWQTADVAGTFLPEVLYDVFIPNASSVDVINTLVVTPLDTPVPADTAQGVSLTLAETEAGVIAGTTLLALVQGQRNFLKISVRADAASTIPLANIRLINVSLDYDGASL